MPDLQSELMKNFVSVSAQEALRWARENDVSLPETNRLGAINNARQAASLPPFKVVKETTVDWEPKKATTLPPLPSEEKTEVVEELRPGQSVAILHPPRHQQKAADLRDVLFQELTELRAGVGNAQRAQAVAKLASQIISTYRVELTTLNRNVIDLPEQKKIGNAA